MDEKNTKKTTKAYSKAFQYFWSHSGIDSPKKFCADHDITLNTLRAWIGGNNTGTPHDRIRNKILDSINKEAKNSRQITKDDFFKKVNEFKDKESSNEYTFNKISEHIANIDIKYPYILAILITLSLIILLAAYPLNKTIIVKEIKEETVIKNGTITQNKSVIINEFTFCNGEYSSTCASYAPNATWYKCKNPNEIAKSLCTTNKRTFEWHKRLVKDKGGNKCGYSVYKVTCLGM